MAGIREQAKRGFETVLARSGVARLASAARRGEVLILAYHNIRPDTAAPAGDRSLHLSVGRFREQLDLLLARHQVVPLSALRGPAPDGGRPRVVITFDDAYHGAVTLGLAEVARRGLPATMFVTPGFLGGRSFWWDALAGSDGLPERLRAESLEGLRGEDAAIRRRAGEQGLALAEPPEDCRGATEASLRAALAHPGLTLGAHTWAHPNLARLEGEALEVELVRPLAWLRERFERVVPWLSYPYGRWSPAVAQAAERAGYEGALRVEGGWCRPGADAPFALPRLNVPAGISRDGFALRLGGLFCR